MISPDCLTAGRHSLALRIDNRIKDIDVGENAHSVSDHTQTNWNGVVGRMILKATSSVFIDDVRVFPDVETGSVRIRADVRNQSGRPFEGAVGFSRQPVSQAKRQGPLRSRCP